MEGLTDLHRHLDGSLRAETLFELGEQQGIALPTGLDSICFYKGMGLMEALKKFGITLSVLQTPGAVKRVASEICEDAAEEGVELLEIRFAPHLHQGVSMEEIVEAALDGISNRAGLILCGLYGDPPILFERLVAISSRYDGVCGIDLAGGPAPDHRFGMKDYAPAFEKARDLGIGRTVHAGEGRPPVEIAVAIRDLHATRIGHGTSLLDDPKVVDLVLEKGVVMEACPTSNVHTGVIPELGAHPLGEWIEKGVPVCINTDNTLLSRINAKEEYENALAMVKSPKKAMAHFLSSGRLSAFGR